MRELGLFLDGEFRTTGSTQEVRAPFDGALLARVHEAGEVEAERALEVAFEGRRRLAAQSTGKRRSLLTGLAQAIGGSSEELAELIATEAGKPITLARGEVKRAIETFTLAAAELTNPDGERIPIDLDASTEGFECYARRFPAGVVVGITPFNFPLNLGAHKLAPALAVGAPFIWKPPPRAPSAALKIAELLRGLGADPAALAVLPCGPELSERLATDPRVRVVSFTGSAKVGWHLLSRVKGKTVLELGGNAAVVVCEDADLDHAAKRCAVGGFAYAGQTCISVQRIYVLQSVFEPFVQKLVAEARVTLAGDPLDARTQVGPVIDERAALRIESWIEEARARGAKVLFGGERQGTLIQPTVMTGVPPDAKLAREEVFGPVVLVEPIAGFDEGLERVNDSQFGLQAALFTNDLRRVRRAFAELEVGGVVINEMPTFRSDNYPYGGVKDSGLGREGVRAAMRDLTEERVLVLGR